MATSNPRALPCIRCHAELPPGSAYCPACGAPQLRVTEAEIAAAADAMASAVVARAPDLRSIQWPAAISVSLTCGTGMGLLCSILFGPLLALLILWSAGGAVAAVALYTRRFPLAGISGGVGMRIGLLTGLFGASVSTLLSSVMLVLERYVFRQGADIDTNLNSAVHYLTQFSAQVTPEGQPNPILNLIVGPEGHAVLLVIGAISSFFFMVFFSMVGGAAGGHYFSLRRRVQSAAP